MGNVSVDEAGYMDKINKRFTLRKTTQILLFASTKILMVTLTVC